MNVDEVMLSLEKLGGNMGPMDLVCEDGEVLYTLMSSNEGAMNVVIRCGGDCILVQVEDVAYIGRTSRGLKVHLRGANGMLSYLTLRAGRRELKPRQLR